MNKLVQFAEGYGKGQYIKRELNAIVSFYDEDLGKTIVYERHGKYLESFFKSDRDFIVCPQDGRTRNLVFSKIPLDKRIKMAVDIAFYEYDRSYYGTLPDFFVTIKAIFGKMVERAESIGDGICVRNAISAIIDTFRNEGFEQLAKNDPFFKSSYESVGKLVEFASESDECYYGFLCSSLEKLRDTMYPFEGITENVDFDSWLVNSDDSSVLFLNHHTGEGSSKYDEYYSFILDCVCFSIMKNAMRTEALDMFVDGPYSLTSNLFNQFLSFSRSRTNMNVTVGIESSGDVCWMGIENEDDFWNFIENFDEKTVGYVSEPEDVSVWASIIDSSVDMPTKQERLKFVINEEDVDPETGVYEYWDSCVMNYIDFNKSAVKYVPIEPRSRYLLDEKRGNRFLNKGWTSEVVDSVFPSKSPDSEKRKSSADDDFCCEMSCCPGCSCEDCDCDGKAESETPEEPSGKNEMEWAMKEIENETRNIRNALENIRGENGQDPELRKFAVSLIENNLEEIETFAGIALEYLYATSEGNRNSSDSDEIER